ncbi:MAG: response regulator [Gallionella sp.]|nr:response regulator [Gallionella sp.]
MQADSYSVEVIGFSEAEKLLLSSAFGLFSRRTPRFFQQEAGAGQPNVFLVDANDAAAVERYRERNASGNVPTIFIGDSSCGTNWPSLVRPIRWLKLLQALELAMSLPAAEARPKAVVDFDITSPSLAATPAAQPAPAKAAASAPASARPAPVSPEIFVAKTVKPVSPAPGAGQPAKSQAESVLVVDDNLTVREFMKSKLAAFNFNVDYAESGEQAIGLTGQKYYACIFLDVIMPGIDGYQVCKLIKSKRATPKTTVIMLTSKDSPFDKIRGSMSGCDAYLTKPVDEEKLLETIVKFLPDRT